MCSFPSSSKLLTVLLATFQRDRHLPRQARTPHLPDGRSCRSSGSMVSVAPLSFIPCCARTGKDCLGKLQSHQYVGACDAPAWTKTLHSLSPICKEGSAQFSLFIEAQSTLNGKLHLTVWYRSYNYTCPNHIHLKGDQTPTLHADALGVQPEVFYILPQSTMFKLHAK